MQSSADAAIGMMDGAYFTSRSEILDFFNSLMNMNLTKIEQTATGAVACQLTDLIFPKSIPMSRVNWEAKTAYEYVNNYKLLQASFTKNRVARHVDVDKLIRAKYQDNLEFCQWLKAFYEQAAPPPRDGYDALAVRMKGKGGKNLPHHFRGRGGGGGGGAAGSNSSRPSARQRAAAPARKPTAAGGGMKSAPARVAPGGASAQKENKSAPSANARAGGRDARASDDAIVADATLMKKNKDLTDRNAELELTLQDIEQERDFYFEKLRGIEVMLQVYEEKDPGEREAAGGADGVIGKIFKVLYATAEDSVLVGDDGELMGGDGAPLGEGEDLHREDEFAEGSVDELEESLLDD